MELLIPLAVACVAVIIVVRVFATSFGQRASRPMRRVDDPWGEGWLSLNEVAERLESSTDDIVRLVHDDAIPFFFLHGADRRAPNAYWFRADEIEDWIVG